MNQIFFTPEEQRIIDMYRESSSKGALAALYAIYDAYNGTNNQNCWCSRLYREQMQKSFYEWYDQVSNPNE